MGGLACIDDREIVVKAVEKQPSCLQWAGRACKVDREIVVKAVEKQPCLQWASEVCKDWAATTNDGTNFIEKGGMPSVDVALEQGFVLVMSPWDDHFANILWCQRMWRKSMPVLPLSSPTSNMAMVAAQPPVSTCWTATRALTKSSSCRFTFDVDASELPCGLNGALYFVAMDADGGKRLTLPPFWST